MHILLLNNHDSFTWNLAELLRSLGKVSFNVVLSGDFRLPMVNKYDRIIFSPGPGLPDEQPAMFEILGRIEKCKVQSSKFKVPAILGVCLGMQAIALYFGGNLINLPSVVHGQPRKLRIGKADHFLFKGIPDGSEVGLYHSWAVNPETLPACLEVLAKTPDGTLMAIAHKTLPVCGVQFHPESIMTKEGKKMMENWILDDG